ncbi:MAG TPA: TonB-dependent receptor [Sphingobium sp.]|uniref:TonB-dependent siderophore receptor n=1 Tax=Sphingobium sp. TaxID=1912891 RepID=UPI002ED1704B
MSEISLQARARISVEPRSDTEVHVEGVHGRLTLRGALEHVLAGTGWRLEEVEGGSLRIVRTDGAADIVVSARRRDFVRTDSSLLTRTDTPLRQTPGTVDTVTEEVLDNQNALSVGEALRNLPGVVFTVGGTSQASIGSDTTGGVTFSGGLRNSAFVQNPPITDVEAIEVLKGPAAILTGSKVAGGVINFVPKRATGRSLFLAQMGTGSDGEMFASGDFGGKVSEKLGLSARLNLFYQVADTLPNGGNDPYSKVINPIIGFRKPGFSLDAGVQFFKTKTAFLDFASYDPIAKVFQSYGSRISPDSNTIVDSTRYTLAFEKELLESDGLTLKLRGRGQIEDVTREQQFQSPAFYSFGTFGSYVANLASYGTDKNYGGYTDIYAKFDTGGVAHQLIVAYDGRRRNYSATNILPQAFFTSGETVALAPVPKDAVRGNGHVRENGIVIQDQLSVGRLHALIGLRQSFYKEWLFDVDPFTQQLSTVATRVKVEKFLPNAGVVYDVGKDTSIYFAYSNDFKPIQAQYNSFSGSPLPPTSVRRYETGIKSSLFDERMTVNASGFIFRTSSDITTDLSHPGFYIPAAGRKGEGVEISAAGSITPTLKVLSGFTYSHSKRTDGSPVTANPEYVANVYATKTFGPANGQNLDFSFGANYNSGYIAQDPFTGDYVKINRSYLDINGGLRYSISGVTVNLTVNNILDRANYALADSIGQINVAAPRTFRLSLSKNF